MLVYILGFIAFFGSLYAMEIIFDAWLKRKGLRLVEYKPRNKKKYILTQLVERR